jgi:hypothetical protein
MSREVVYGSIFCSGFVVNIDMMYKVQLYVLSKPYSLAKNV